MSTRKLTLEEFIKRSNKIHNNIYCYDKSVYVNSITKIIIYCTKHQCEFQQLPREHYLGKTGCKECSKNKFINSARSTKEEFVKKAQAIHGDKYDYSNFIYVTNKTLGTIKCNTCSYSWLTTPTTHLFNKSGCKECKVNSIYTKEYYLKNDIPNHPCSLYIVEFNNQNERFIKIGITKHKDILKRFRGYSEKYSIRVLNAIESDFFSAYDLEQKIISELSDFKYRPLILFKGATECLNFEALSKAQTYLTVP